MNNNSLNEVYDISLYAAYKAGMITKSEILPMAEYIVNTEKDCDNTMVEDVLIELIYQ